MWCLFSWLRPLYDSIRPAKPAEPATMPAALTPEQIAIVKATAPVLKEHGTTITTVFYDNIIAAHPELNNMFSKSNQGTGRQARALATSVLAYATYVDDLEKLQHAVARIAHKHVSLQVTPAQYDLVGKFLIEAIGQVLKDAATPEIVDAWTNAYGALAAVFIGLEGSMYEANKAEGWSGWRKFRVERKMAESESITSLYLVPSDGAVPLPKFLPGQYVSLKLFVPALECFQSRQYSLSEAPKETGAYYRISVKKEQGDVVDMPGVISNMLHGSIAVGDEVELSHPQGEFFLDPSDKSKDGVPVVLLSAGVGATPLMSILGSLAAVPNHSGKGESEKPAVRRPVSWIHASRSGNSLPFGDAVRNICRENENVSAQVFLGTLSPEEKASANYEFAQARLDLSKLDEEHDLFIGDAKAEYYICGPETFMTDMRKALVEMGVDKNRVHLELFATGDVADE